MCVRVLCMFVRHVLIHKRVASEVDLKPRVRTLVCLCLRVSVRARAGKWNESNLEVKGLSLDQNRIFVVSQ